MYVAGTKTG
eukprot:g42973.t1